MRIDLCRDTYLEFEKLALGIYNPLRGFMSKADYQSCVRSMTLANGEVFPLPVVLPIEDSLVKKISIGYISY